MGCGSGSEIRKVRFGICACVRHRPARYWGSRSGVGNAGCVFYLERFADLRAFDYVPALLEKGFYAGSWTDLCPI